MRFLQALTAAAVACAVIAFIAAIVAGAQAAAAPSVDEIRAQLEAERLALEIERQSLIEWRDDLATYGCDAIE